MRLAYFIIAGVLAPATALAADSWTTPKPGIRRLHRTTSSQNINVLVVDLCAPGVSVRATKSGERQRTVSSFAGLVAADAAINGDFFSFQTYSTGGPSMGDGAAWGGADGTYVAPAQFGAHRLALPAHESTAGVEPWARQVVSGHPSLIVGGAKRDNTGDTLCTARHPRTALGFSGDKRKLILAVVDGRATNRIGMTCAELGNLMAEMGATDAVNLDGGGSSTMWLGGPGVINYPSDGQQRVVANHLGVRAKGTGDAPHCPNPTYAASFVGVQAPLEMTAGEEAVVYLELDNTGDTSWTPQQTRVGTQDPQDRDSVFFKAENWVSASRPTGADKTYGPATTGRFTWAMVAPEVQRSTMFEETFQLVQEGVTWFGPKHTMSIIVHPTSGPTPIDEEPPPDETMDEMAASSGCSTSGAASAWLVVALCGLRRRRARSKHSC